MVYRIQTEKLRYISQTDLKFCKISQNNFICIFDNELANGP
jgi:hypothetical protein